MTYSNIILLTNNIQNIFNLFPNPADNKIQLTFDSDVSSTAMIEIIDLQGRRIQNQRIETQDSINIFEINTAALPQGTYMMRLTSDTNSQVTKFMVNR